MTARRGLDGAHRAERREYGSEQLKKLREGVMKIGQEVVFVRTVEGAQEGSHGKVMAVSERSGKVRCRLRERPVVVMARTWDILPEALWERLLKHQRGTGALRMP
jgi:hypothetical protein